MASLMPTIPHLYFDDFLGLEPAFRAAAPPAPPAYPPADAYPFLSFEPEQKPPPARSPLDFGLAAPSLRAPSLAPPPEFRPAFFATAAPPAPAKPEPPALLPDELECFAESFLAEPARSAPPAAQSPAASYASSASSALSSASSTTSGGSSPRGARRRRAPARPISKEKLEERRRRNRESSSRCYYNRKQKIEAAEAALAADKRRAMALYERELELRRQNARLKKDLVLRGIPIPPHMLAPGRPAFPVL